MVVYIWGWQEVFQWDDQPLSSEWRGTRPPDLSLMHKGQIQPRYRGGYKRQYVHSTDEAIPGQGRELFGGKGEGKCTIRKILIAPGMNSNGFYCPVQELVWSQSRMTRKPDFFSCKHAFNQSKLNAPFSPLKYVFSIQLRDFGLKRHSSFCNDNTSSCNTRSYIYEVS